MPFALDTNVVVAALKHDPRVRSRLLKLAPNDVILPAPALGELVYGARRSAKRDHNLKRLQQIRRGFTVAPLDEAAARCFGELKATLAERGELKSDMDLLIAAIAINRGAILVTHDFALADLPNLVVEDWLA